MCNRKRFVQNMISCSGNRSKNWQQDWGIQNSAQLGLRAVQHFVCSCLQSCAIYMMEWFTCRSTHYIKYFQSKSFLMISYYLLLNTGVPFVWRSSWVIGQRRCKGGLCLFMQCGCWFNYDWLFQFTYPVRCSDVSLSGGGKAEHDVAPLLMPQSWHERS